MPFENTNVFYVNKYDWFGKDPMASVSTMFLYAIAKTGHHATLIAAGDPDANWQADLPVRFNLQPIPTFNIHLCKRTILKKTRLTFRFYLSACFHIAKNRQRGKKTIVITRNTTFLSWLVLLKWVLGCTVLFESHSFHGNNKTSEIKENLKRGVLGLSNQFKIIERIFLNRCNGLICQAGPQRDLYVSDYVRIPTAVIPLGSNLTDLDEMSTQQVCTIKKKIAYIGSYFGYVDSDLIFDSLSECKDPAITLLWIGLHESDLERFSKEVQKRGIAQKCELYGWMSHNAMLKKLRDEAGAGIVLYKPSMLTSVLVSPTKIFDYFSATLPVIGPNLPSVTAHVRNKIDGIYYEPGNVKSLVNAFSEMFSDSETYLEMRKNTVEAAKLNSWENRAERFNVFLQEVIT